MMLQHIRVKEFILLLISIACININPQTETQPVAQIGNSKISVDEFKIRYELTPQMYREQKETSNELKQEFLYTLIAEKLLALYGESIKLDSIEVVRYTLKNFKEMFIRDALYDLMITNKAKHNADSLLGFYLDNATMAKCNYIRTNSFEEAQKIYDLLNKGVPFEYFLSDLSLNGGDTISITFGQFDELIENEILTLPENGFTHPIMIEDNWYIISVAVRYYPILDKTIGWEAEYKRLNKLANERAESAFYKDYKTNLFKNLNVKANGKLLKFLADEVFKLLERKRQIGQEQKKYYLEVADIALLVKTINSNILNAIYFKIPNDSISLKEFLYFLRMENLSADSIDYQKILDALNSKTKKFIEYKVLTNEGYKHGLENDKIVNEKFNLWKDNYFYQLVLSEFADSVNVSEDEIRTYYNHLHKGKLKLKEVNVTEIVVDNLEDAEKVLAELENIINIAEVEKRYSILPASSDLHKFKSISSFKEIGPILDKMNAGEIYGPLKVSYGYSIFKLNDVREDSTFVNASSEEIKKEYEPELRYLKKKDTFNKFIAKLATEKNIVINHELLKKIYTTSHNALVFQLLGFGGKLTAVPLITPNSEWVEEWFNNLKVTP